jgi:hypothetical protein
LRPNLLLWLRIAQSLPDGTDHAVLVFDGLPVLRLTRLVVVVVVVVVYSLQQIDAGIDVQSRATNCFFLQR